MIYLISNYQCVALEVGRLKPGAMLILLRVAEGPDSRIYNVRIGVWGTIILADLQAIDI